MHDAALCVDRKHCSANNNRPGESPAAYFINTNDPSHS
jgi:hypothetical protein